MNKSIILALGALTILFSGCNNYRKVSYKKVDFYKKRKVVEKMDDYDLYIQKGDKTYEFDVTEREGDVLKGTTKRVASAETASENNSEVTKEMRDDMIVRVGDDMELETENGELTTISPENVQEVEVYAKEDQGAIGAIGTAFLVVIGVILALILILVLAIS